MPTMTNYLFDASQIASDAGVVSVVLRWWLETAA